MVLPYLSQKFFSPSKMCNVGFNGNRGIVRSLMVAVCCVGVNKEIMLQVK